MPKEAFYTPTVTEGQAVEFARADAFSVDWAPDGDYVVPGGGTSIAVIAGVHLDASGVTRLIRVLNRVRRTAAKRTR